MQHGLSICVFCGSRSGVQPEFAADAKELGAAIAKHRWRLVYGAGDVGIMGEVAASASASGAEVLGVIPIHLVGREREGRAPGRHVITENMHERKKVMFMNSDAIAVLPGGAGSLDEFFEVLTWRQLGLHAKPIFVLNTNGFWDPLVGLVDHVIDQGFADPSLRTYVRVVGSVEALVEALRAMPAQE